MTLKIDFINSAYSMGQVSGITRNPTPSEITTALNRLESMAAEWSEANICTGYTFEENPDSNTPHNVPRKYWTAFESSLMLRLLADYGKEPTASLVLIASSSFDSLLASTDNTQQVQYPSRMPRGSGNRCIGYCDLFYSTADIAPNECATVKMVVGDVDDFYFDFTSYLNEGEDVDSAVITSDSGLTISSETVTTPRVTYTVTATGGTDDNKTLNEVKIVMTTTDSRILTRVTNFELTEIDIT